jgi:hypothetical protein
MKIMYCPACGERLRNTSCEAIQHSSLDEDSIDFKCDYCGDEWRLSNNSMDQDGVKITQIL